jgi:hypothetical protein
VEEASVACSTQAYQTLASGRIACKEHDEGRSRNQGIARLVTSAEQMQARFPDPMGFHGL